MDRFKIFILIGILVLGFFLRLNNLYTWPRLGATFDEYAWTWQGINLIQKHEPISWSPHPQYKNAKNIIYQKTHFRIVSPYLEHPPLFGLVAGSFALLNGVKGMYDLTIRDIRPLALILGTFSIFMVYLLAKELFGAGVGLLSSLFYATIPTIAVGSRIVQNENFLIPFWLLSLFLLNKYLKTGRKRFRNLAAILAGLLSLAKVPWLVVGLSLSFILAFYRKLRDAFLTAGIVLLFFSLFFLYGFYFDGHLFLSLWGLQLNRYDLSFASIYALFQKPFLADRFYLDGWIYFGWFAIFLLFKDLKKYSLIILPFLAYFMVFITGIPDEPGHGWYRYPFYPFLIISIAIFIKEYFAKNWAFTFIFLALIGTTLFQNTWANVFGFSYPVLRLLIVTWIFVLLPIFLNFKNINKGSKIVSWSYLLIFILMNIWSILLYNEQ